MLRVLAYLAPLAVGLGVPAALALARQKPPRRRAAPAALVLGATLAVLSPLAFSESLSAFLKLAILLAGFSALVAGAYLLAEALGGSPELAQVAAGLLSIGLLSTVFWFKPVLADAEERGLSEAEIAGRIDLALEVNPFMVTGYSIFGDSLLHRASLYPIQIEDFKHSYPRWGATAAGYAGAGLAFFLAALGAGALRRRLWTP
jgi:hypothetical protein